MKWIDTETGLPFEQAEKIKQKLKQLEEENMKLREEIEILEEENLHLKIKIEDLRFQLENVGVRKVSDMDGDRVELTPNKEFIIQLTSSGVLKPVYPNMLRIGEHDSYLNDVITANLTVASTIKDKQILKEVDEEFEGIVLPKPKKYKRLIGRGEEEIGFTVEELPEMFRRGNGYNLITLISYIIWKLNKIEQQTTKEKS